MSIIDNVVRSATRTKEDTLRCLTFCRENERYLRLLSKCNCELYVIPKREQSDWKTNVSEIPENIFVFRDEHSGFNSRPFFDCVIANDRLQEFDMASSISQSLHIPLITIDHVGKGVSQKLPAASSVNVGEEIEGRVGNINVCLSENIKKSWNTNAHGISIEIPICLDTEITYKFLAEDETIPIAEDETIPKNGIVIDNNVPQPLMNAIEGLLHKIEIIPRFPETSFGNIRNAKVYINTWNNIDIKTLEAMSFGCVTISPRTPETELIIKNEENGFLFSDFSELPKILEKCEKEIYDKISQKSIETAKEVSVDAEFFVKKWNQVFAYVSETFFLRN